MRRVFGTIAISLGFLVIVGRAEWDPVARGDRHGHRATLATEPIHSTPPPHQSAAPPFGPRSAIGGQAARVTHDEEHGVLHRRVSNTAEVP